MKKYCIDHEAFDYFYYCCAIRLSPLENSLNLQEYPKVAYIGKLMALKKETFIQNLVFGKQKKDIYGYAVLYMPQFSFSVLNTVLVQRPSPFSLHRFACIIM